MVGAVRRGVPLIAVKVLREEEAPQSTLLSLSRNTRRRNGSRKRGWGADRAEDAMPVGAFKGRRKGGIRKRRKQQQIFA